MITASNETAAIDCELLAVLTSFEQHIDSLWRVPQGREDALLLATRFLRLAEAGDFITLQEPMRKWRTRIRMGVPVETSRTAVTSKKIGVTD